MVEMLGVLAIIGILSVAGIAAYSSAMKKHRANELLYEASKRATVVAMQAAQGRTTFSVAEFGNDGWSVTTENLTNQFGIVSSSVSADVCKQVVNSVGTGSAIKQVLSGSTNATGDSSKCSDATITLVYNNDLSADISSEPIMVENCSEGTATNNYGLGDITNERTEAGNCRCPQDKPQWDGTECKVADTGDTCTSHTSQVCPEGYYCKFSPSNCFESGRGGDGVCTKITGGIKIDGHWVGPNVDWWSANSWCIGKGSEGLITYTTLHNEYGCDKSKAACDWSVMDAKGFDRKNHQYWSAENYNECRAYKIDGSAGMFGRGTYTVTDYFTLCE